MKPVLAAVLLTASQAAAQSVPDGVRYAKAPEAVNDRARAALREGLSGNPRTLAALAAEGAPALMAGPFLSRTLLDTGLVAPSQFGRGIYRVKFSKDVVPQFPALAARNAKERAALDAALERWLPASRTVEVRPLTADEMVLVWYFISWDITEPVFAVDLGARTLVVDFDDDGRSVSWLEDISQPCGRLVWKSGSLQDCFCFMVVPNGSARRVALRAQPRGAAGTCPGAHTALE